jgi:hypothetical protein
MSRDLPWGEESIGESFDRPSHLRSLSCFVCNDHSESAVRTASCSVDEPLAAHVLQSKMQCLTRDHSERLLADLLSCHDAEEMTGYPVDPKVGDVCNNEPGLCEAYERTLLRLTQYVSSRIRAIEHDVPGIECNVKAPCDCIATAGLRLQSLVIEDANGAPAIADEAALLKIASKNGDSRSLCSDHF